jgi:hypothetical protein
MNATMYAGLAVSSQATNTLAQANFDHVSITSLDDSSLPGPWVSQNIHSSSATGFQGYGTYTNASVFTVNGSGQDVGSAVDEGQFVCQPMSGDCQIIARITGQTANDPLAKAGVMFRTSPDSGSFNSFLYVTPDGHWAFQQRTTLRPSTTVMASGTSSLPIWLKLESHSGIIIASQSSDGLNWTIVATQAGDLGSQLYAGLMVSSHDSTALGQAVYDNVSVKPLAAWAPLPTPWKDQDVGTPSIAGKAGSLNGTIYMSGSGNDVWNTSDSFHFAYQKMTGDGTIITKVTSQSAASDYTKAGVMIRESLDPSSAFVYALITPGHGATFQYRLGDGYGSAPHLDTKIDVQAPIWLKLQRAGNVFTAWYRTDATSWSLLSSGPTNPSSVTAAMAGNSVVYVGLAVTSHLDNPTSPPVDPQITLASFESTQIVNPTSTDTDGNGLADTWEIQYFGHIGIDPTAPGSQGLTIYEDYLQNLDPRSSATIQDTNGNGIPDAWEYKWFGNLTTATSTSDYDHDGISDLHEYILGTNPLVPDLDSDHDGLPDSYERYQKPIYQAVSHSLRLKITEEDVAKEVFHINGNTISLSKNNNIYAESNGGRILNATETAYNYTLNHTATISTDQEPTQDLQVVTSTINGQAYSSISATIDSAPYSATRSNFTVSLSNCLLLNYQFGSDPNTATGITSSGDDTTIGPGDGTSSFSFDVQDTPAQARATYTVILSWTTMEISGYQTITRSDPFNPDTDGDGLSDGDEFFITHTDPLNPDTDGDGMPDGWEYRNGLNPLDSSDAPLDPDHDGLTNLQEYQFNSNPQVADGDLDVAGAPAPDGMGDKYEVYQGLSPLLADGNVASLHRDHLTRLQEMNDPNPSLDTDGDGLSDYADGLLRTQGVIASTTIPDGIPNAWKLLHGLDPKIDYAQTTSDTDGDGLSAIQEYQNQTLPDHFDTDNDGLGDGWEIAQGTNPRTLMSNLNGWWRFEGSEGANPAYIFDFSGGNLDASGFGVQPTSGLSYNGVFYGSDTTAYHFGPADAVEHNGAYILVRHDRKLLPADGLTYSFWFKPDTANPVGDSDILNMAGSYSLVMRQDRTLSFTVYVGSNQRTVVTPSGLVPGAWNHIAVSYDTASGTQSVYLGSTSNATSLVISQAWTAGVSIAELSDTLAAPLIIGAPRQLPCRTPVGDLDDLRVYHGALSSNDIASLSNYNAPLTAPNSNPNAEQNLDWDHDGLTNLEEFKMGTDPHNADTDGDGLTDGEEVHGMTETTNGPNGTTITRLVYSNPLLVDTDGDTIPDGVEVHATGYEHGGAVPVWWVEHHGGRYDHPGVYLERSCDRRDPD